MSRRAWLILAAIAVLPAGLLAGAAERDPSMPPPLIGEDRFGGSTTAPSNTPTEKTEFQASGSVDTRTR
jgi:hypothetical protein